MGISSEAAWARADEDPGADCQAKVAMSKIPRLVVLSSAWCSFDWYVDFWKRLCASSNARFVVKKATGHQALCDLPLLLPRYITTFLHTIVKDEADGMSAQDIVDSVNTEIISFLDSSSFFQN